MMNYSDYDSDGYSSNEDADYVPSGEERTVKDCVRCSVQEMTNGGFCCVKWLIFAVASSYHTSG